MLSFQKVPHQTIDGQQKFRFVAVRTESNENSITELGFFIEAGRAGVEMSGKFTISDFKDLQPFAKAVSDAWREHQRLLPKITRTLSGH